MGRVPAVGVTRGFKAIIVMGRGLDLGLGSLCQPVGSVGLVDLQVSEVGTEVGIPCLSR